jgi:hypothetical protein
MSKSWINRPDPDSGTVPEGQVLIEGVAFGGMTGVRGVEVSTDGGKTWLEAMFVGEDHGKLRLAPVRAAGAPDTGHLHDCLPRHRRQGQRAARAAAENAPGYSTTAGATTR